MEMREVQIPFAGFYCSWHDSEIDRALEMAFQDDSGCHVHTALYQMAWDAIDFRAVHLAFAQEYCSDWLAEAEISGGRFKAMESPREYNFSTDRIFAEIPLSELERMKSETDSAILARIARERFTSRDGFISYYSPNVANWGEFSEWDHNQFGTLALAYWETKKGESWESSDWEMYYAGELECNGYLSNMVFSDEADPDGKAGRAANVAYALRQRATRGEPKSAAAFADSACY